MKCGPEGPNIIPTLMTVMRNVQQYRRPHQNETQHPGVGHSFGAAGSAVLEAYATCCLMQPGQALRDQAELLGAAETTTVTWQYLTHLAASTWGTA